MKRLACVLLICLTCWSCGKTSDRKKTYPVVGVILIDGQPIEQVAVRCVSLDGIDTANPTFSAAFTDAAGKFEISTYEQGDGVPEGNYALTIAWGEWNYVTMQYGGDKLNGKYNDPQTSTIKFEVQDGKQTDLGTIAVSSK